MSDKTLIDTPFEVIFSSDINVITAYIEKLKKKPQNDDVQIEIARMYQLISEI